MVPHCQGFGRNGHHHHRQTPRWVLPLANKYSTHTVRESKWKTAKGDVLKELSAACKIRARVRRVSRPGIATTRLWNGEYNDVFVNMMKELLRTMDPSGNSGGMGPTR